VNSIPSPWEDRKLPPSGTIMLSQIKTEFNKGDNLTDYLGAVSGVPSSPPIKLTDFYGKEAGEPVVNWGTNFDGPIDEEFSNSVAIYWKIRKYSNFIPGSPQYGGYFSATGQGKFPCFWAPSQADGLKMLQDFQKRTYFGLCGDGVGLNTGVGWDWIDMIADGGRTEVLVYPSKHSYADPKSARFCDAIDVGSGASASWYS